MGNMSPALIKDTPVDFFVGFPKPLHNFTMLNQYDNCSCYHLDPERPDKGIQIAEARHDKILWVKFAEDFDCGDLSAETMAQMF